MARITLTHDELGEADPLALKRLILRVFPEGLTYDGTLAELTGLVTPSVEAAQAVVPNDKDEQGIREWARKPGSAPVTARDLVGAWTVQEDEPQHVVPVPLPKRKRRPAWVPQWRAVPKALKSKRTWNMSDVKDYLDAPDTAAVMQKIRRTNDPLPTKPHRTNDLYLFDPAVVEAWVKRQGDVIDEAPVLENITPMRSLAEEKQPDTSYLTPVEACHVLRIKRDDLDDLARRNLLTPHQSGIGGTFYRRDDVEAWRQLQEENLPLLEVRPIPEDLGGKVEWGVKDVATYLGQTYTWVYNRMHKMQMPHYRTEDEWGRKDARIMFRPADVQQWELEQRRNELRVMA